MKNKEAEKRICASCGEEFGCGAKSGNCWCFALELEPQTLAVLRNEFESCLCRGCLERRANESADSKSNRTRRAGE
jgi:hypothetical protein